MAIAESLFEKLGCKYEKIHLTGSITSNSYAKNADIDLHFISPELLAKFNNDSDAANKALRETFEAMNVQKIAAHPFEVYLQSNEFQDYMSVGCYDVLNKKWEVGPELKDSDFNPYSAYYREVQQKSSRFAKDIRNIIFEVYEKAIACKKMLKGNDSTLFQQTLAELKTSLFKAGDLFDDIRKMRKAFSSPTSKEQALEFRSSHKWHVTDAAFKLFDKYGYLAILKAMKTYAQLISTDNALGVEEELLEAIVKAIKDNIGNQEKLADTERIDEGPVQVGILAALLAIPGILPAKSVQHAISSTRNYAQAVNKMNKKVRMIGDYTAFQVANIIARTLYAEARNDGKTGFKAVASVIYNRADGKMADFAAVCKKKYQFSCWNKMSADDWKPAKFKIKIPTSVKDNARNERLWKQAMEIAAEMLANGNVFKPVTTANIYYATSMKKAPSWAKSLTNTETIGSHTFGYLKKHISFK